MAIGLDKNSQIPFFFQTGVSGGKKVEDVEKDLSLEESFYPLRKVELPLNGWMDC